MSNLSDIDHISADSVLALSIPLGNVDVACTRSVNGGSTSSISSLLNVTFFLSGELVVRFDGISDLDDGNSTV